MAEMAFCGEHWTRLRNAVEARGLGDLMAQGGREAVARQLHELEGDPDWSSFDPLMYAFWNLLANGSRIVSVPLFAVDGCPLCWLIAEHDRTCDGDPRCLGAAGYEAWITKAADAAASEWRRRVSAEVSP